MEFGQIWGNSGNFRKIQWNSVGFCMALNMKSVGVPGFRGQAGFSGISGDLGPQKAFAQMAALLVFLSFLFGGREGGSG